MQSRSTTLAAAALLTASAVLPAQPVQPTFRARTVVTELEFGVRDATGRAIHDLVAADVEVIEDGVAQHVLSIEPIGSPPTSPAEDTPHHASQYRRTPGVIAFASTESSTRARAWALVVDDLRLPGFMRDRYKAFLRDLVAGMAPDDAVALVPTSGDRRASQEFTRDRAVVLHAIDRLRFPRELDGAQGVSSLGTPPRPSGMVSHPPIAPARLDLIGADNRFVSTLTNVAAMLGRSAHPGRTMVLVSHGVRVSLSDDYRRLVEASRGTDTLLRRLNELQVALDRIERSGVTLHVLDPTAFDAGLTRRLETVDRLTGPSNQAHVRRADPALATRVMAERSGGLFLADSEAPADAAARLLDEVRARYLVRYQPSNDALDDRRRVVEIRIRRPAVHVTARAAYARVPDAEFEALRTTRPLGVALAQALPVTQLAVEAAASLTPAVRGRSTIAIVPSVVGAGGVQLLPARDRLEVLAVVMDGKGRTRSTKGGRADLEARDGRFTAPVLVFDPLGPGRYHARIAIRSTTLDRTGSVSLDIEVPER